jgi:beta-RFAP synthase
MSTHPSPTIHVSAPSRLHFGLLRLPAVSDGPRTRHFGSVGLMIEQPGVHVSVEPALEWSAAGPLAERALAFAQQAVQALADGKPAFAIRVVRAPQEHIGLGVGTQLGLAVSRAVSRALGHDLRAVELAALAGRGERSGIGVHGFEHGGFLIDGGRKTRTGLAPLIARQAFPEDWRVLLVLPRRVQGVHGERERAAFATLARRIDPERATEKLSRLALLRILPALVEHDLPAFGEALYEFNRSAGEVFTPVQGGPYSSAEAAEIVKAIRALGVEGVGQSSWGPALFAVAEADAAKEIKDRIESLGGDHDVIITPGANLGARTDEAVP